MKNIGLQGPYAVRRVMGTSVSFLAVVLLTFGVLLTMGSQALNRAQSRAEQAVAETALARAREVLVRDITSATVWTQAYDKLRPGGDEQWAHEEIGLYFATNRRHDLTLALDTSDRPFLAWRAGRAVPAADVADLLRRTQPLIRRVRRQELVHGSSAREPKAGDISTADTASGVIRTGGQLYLVGVSTVTPDTHRPGPRPDRGTLVISAQRMNGVFLENLRALGFQDAAIVVRPAAAAQLELADPDGATVGVLGWTARKPPSTSCVTPRRSCWPRWACCWRWGRSGAAMSARSHPDSPRTSGAWPRPSTNSSRRGTAPKPPTARSRTFWRT